MGSPAYTWIISLIYVHFLLNHTHTDGINGIPITKSTGSTSGISPLLCFQFWKLVYYNTYNSDLPSHSSEKRGRWVGIAEHVWHAMTFKLFADDTQNIIFWYNVCSSEEPMKYNPCLEPHCGGAYPFVKSRPKRDNQSVSLLDYSLRKDEQGEKS